MNFDDLQQFVVVKRPTGQKAIADMTTNELREACLLRSDEPKNGHVRIYLKLSQFRLEGAIFNVPAEKLKQAELAIEHAIIEGKFDDALYKAQQRVIAKQAKPVETVVKTVVEPEPEYVFDLPETKPAMTADEEIMLAAGDYLL